MQLMYHVLVTNVYLRDSTDNVGDVEAIGESAGCTMSRRINAVRIRVGTSSGDQIVVVAIIN